MQTLYCSYHVVYNNTTINVGLTSAREANPNYALSKKYDNIVTDTDTIPSFENDKNAQKSKKCDSIIHI